MRRKLDDKIVVKSKYFNPFNDLSGVIVGIDDNYQKITVKLDDVERLQVFDKEELKTVKEVR